MRERFRFCLTVRSAIRTRTCEHQCQPQGGIALALFARVERLAATLCPLRLSLQGSSTGLADIISFCICTVCLSRSSFHALTASDLGVADVDVGVVNRLFWLEASSSHDLELYMASGRPKYLNGLKCPNILSEFPSSYRSLVLTTTVGGAQLLRKEDECFADNSPCLLSKGFPDVLP